VELGADLDLKKVLKYPLGLSEDSKECHPFTGTFDGKGHSLKNIEMDNTNDPDYSDSSLFCSLKNAIVMNLTIATSCKFSGYRASGLSMFAEENTTIAIVKNDAEVVGKKRGCGLVNKILEGASVIFVNDENTGTIMADHTACGMFFQNPNSSSFVVSCVNKGNVKASLAFGIATMKLFSDPSIFAVQVVNVGNISSRDPELYSKYNAYAFWPHEHELFSSEIYALKDTCNPNGESSFDIYYQSGEYLIEGTNENVCDILNDGDNMVWQKSLDIVGTAPDVVKDGGERAKMVSLLILFCSFLFLIPLLS